LGKEGSHFFAQCKTNLGENEKMQKSKTMAIMIALFLTLSMSASMMLQSSVGAHSPPWITVSYAYLSVAPNPVGVGQTVDVCMWVDTAMPSAALGNDIRRHDYTLTITKPDGTTLTQTWGIINDPTGVQFYTYAPDQVGNYTFFFSYPQQTYTWSGTYQNDIFLASNRTQYLTVQQNPLPAPIDSYPLPTEYWTRPIEEQNTYWYTIASNWLSAPYIIGAGAAYIGGEQPYGTAPNSAHIMWTKPLQYGGVVGGNETQVAGETYYEGLSYNPRFGNPIIMQGTIYYQEPYGNSGTGGDYVAVDLRTGQEQWRINASATGTSLVPSFGYLYSYDGPNQHGVLPNGLLIATTTVSGQGTVWRGYDPRTGVLTSMNVTNVPGGTNVAGPSGEYLKYILTNYGNSTKPNWYLAQWNSSDAFGMITGAGLSPTGWYSGTENASLPSAYDWNVSVNLQGTGWSIGTAGRGLVPLVSLGNMVLMIQGTFGGHISDSGATITSDPANITAISINPATLGQVLWTHSYPQAPGNNTRFLSAWDPTNGVFVFSDKESFANWGYSLANGNYLWGPSYPPSTGSVDWNYMIWYTPFCQYGKLYSCAFSGLLYCWDVKTGSLEWIYGNGGAGNSTAATLITPYGFYPEFVEAVADGKIYLVGNEHSPNSPMYKGSLLRCINATNGAELWTIFGWGNMMSGSCAPIADGFLSVYNPYDGQIYTYGKGPSGLTVSITDDVIQLGSSIMIKGTITDISSGTKQNEQAARFPNGVPCVSDASQSAWMEYIYMQKPRPTNTTGVPIRLSVLDSNGNYRQIGTTTSNDGFFSFNWTPDIQGKYTVYASFAGTESYWLSNALTAFAVDAAAPTASPYPVTTLPPMEMYIVAAAAAIIVAIVISFAITILVLRKRP
jgi:hypothetical protein